MKFNNGFWLLKDGIHQLHPVEAREIKIENKNLTIYAPTKKIDNRGDTLNRPQLTIELSSPLENIIKVKMYHHSGGINSGPFFDIKKSESTSPIIKTDGDSISYSTGKLEFLLKDKGVWNPQFLYDGLLKTGSPINGAGYIKTDNGSTFFKEQLDLDVNETIYGLGERFTPFVKNGQIVDTWNEDGGTSSEQAYKNIPFYISSKGYGVFVNHPEKVSFEVGSEVVSRVQFSVPGESIEYYIIGGDDLKCVLSNYTKLTGKPGLPPAWSFGLWLTTSFTTSYDEKTVNSFIDGMAQRDIPLQVFHFDCFWMKEFQWCDFKWDPDTFPDPEGMLLRLKQKGLKNCLWINSYIAQKSSLYDEGKESGYLLKKTDGSVWQTDLWQAGMALVDFTNPEATKWYQNKLRRLIDQGVDSFKTDFGERIPTDVIYHDGSDPVKMHNYYTYLYNKAVYEVLVESKGKKEAMLFARSATVGGQQFPVHWGGDCSATYSSMAESLRGGLSLCLSGFGYWSHDIGGFEQTAEADLYKRWAAFGLLSSHSRLHGSESYRVPWNFDEEAVDVLRFFTKLKNSLMPYLYDSACETAETGIPMMRAMVLEFPEDPTCKYLDTQYMLGDSLLVAPIFNKTGDVTYYLPEGKWISLIDGSIKEGLHWYSENHGYLSIPLMVKAKTILATNRKYNTADYDFSDGVILQLFGFENGDENNITVRNRDGNIKLFVTAIKDNNCYKIMVEGAITNWNVQIDNGKVINLSGQNEVLI